MILKPFRHDCEHCIFVSWIIMQGRWGNLYYCPNNAGHLSDHGSVVVRFSDEPADYWSMPVFAGTEPHELNTLGHHPEVRYGKLESEAC